MVLYNTFLWFLEMVEIFPPFPLLANNNMIDSGVDSHGFCSIIISGDLKINVVLLRIILKTLNVVILR